MKTINIQEIQDQVPSMLDADGSFSVREMKKLDMIIAAVFYFIFLLALGNLIGSHRPVYQQTDNKVILLILLPAIGYTLKAINNRAYILINRKGIYINNYFITDWNNFVSARYTERQVTLSTHDNFVLVLYYYKDDGICYRRKIPEVLTQNKAEEEVIAAIRYFYFMETGERIKD